jgi:hypothetical protein
MWLVAAAAPTGPAVAPPPRPISPGFDLADWTPRPAAGKAEPWERATDKDWVDARFRSMNTGPFLNCTMDYPLGKARQRIFKATAVKLGEKGDAGIVFDRNTLQVAAAWTGGWLNHSDRRFGLLNTPTPRGTMLFATPPGPGWADPEGESPTAGTRYTAPLPGEWGRYRGLSVHGDRVVFRYTVGACEVLDSPGFVSIAGASCITRSIRTGPANRTLILAIGKLPKSTKGSREQSGGSVRTVVSWLDENRWAAVAVGGNRDTPELAVDDAGLVTVKLRPSREPRTFRVSLATGSSPQWTAFHAALEEQRVEDLPTLLIKPGPRRWGEPIVTPLVRGASDGPFAVDTLTIPYKNRFNALFFCTGLDFLPDNRVAVCTCHGDVWLVAVDEKAATCSWQRYATGLYHPLGLKVVDGKVVVLERGQLTRLHDLDDNGEADFYECLNNDWHTGGGEHSYDTCLETDPDGNFYFFKTGDTDTPTGGCLIKVSKDGKKSEIFCTGFRHPIGMGMSPGGILTGADQEGNWMPATRIDEYRKGGFYGDMRAHHRDEAPKLYDGPLCWVPREVDNSAGGQTWVPEGKFGPLAGLPLHFSYGRCRPFVLLRQELAGGLTQGGVAPLDVTFLSGVCRGRFASDGHLYVCGLNGWQTSAKADGCLQRVRYTGKPLDIPVAMKVEGNAIRLTFSRPLDPKSVASSDHYRAAWWNYHWSKEYGSKRWKVSNPDEEGQDDVPARSATLLADGRTIEMTFDLLQPVMQMQVGYNVVAADGRKVVGSVFITIHSTPKSAGGGKRM